MANYDRFVKTAKRLIAKYGEVCNWVIEGQETDSDEPWKADNAPDVTHKVRIAMFPNDGSGLETLAKMLGADVTIGNVIGYMANVPFEVSDRDTIVRTAAGKTLSINSIDEINPDGKKTILYILKCTQ